ncbi:MAG: hypothetical protein R2724_00245 [Bryobacterales bacterium]
MIRTCRDFFSGLTTGLAGARSLPCCRGKPLLPPMAAFCAQGQARVADLLSRRRFAHRLWDYKPELEKRSGEELPPGAQMVTFQGKNGALDGLALEVHPARAIGQADLRAVAEAGRACRTRWRSSTR